MVLSSVIIKIVNTNIKVPKASPVKYPPTSYQVSEEGTLGEALIPKRYQADNPPKHAPRNYARVLTKKSLNYQEVVYVTGWGMIPFLIKNPKETAGLTCPPEKGITNKIAVNKDKVTYQSYPSEAQIPWANIAVPTNSHQKIFQSNKLEIESSTETLYLSPYLSSFST